MNTRVNYRDIPKDERKRLATEVYRLTPRLRTIRFAAIFLPILFSGLLTDSVVPKGGPLLPRLGIRVLFSVILCAAIWETLGRPRLKSEVEKLKNA